MEAIVEKRSESTQGRTELAFPEKDIGQGSEDAKVKLNLGCGGQVVPGWTNVDYAVGARLAKLPIFGALVRSLGLFDVSWDRSIVIQDLRRPLPWPDESVDVIYASHILEHFSRDEGKDLLAECRRLLRPNGILRVLVPDLKAIVDSYLADDLRADGFVEALGVLYGRSSNPFKDRLYPWLQFPHKCMYDQRCLLKILDGEGFIAEGRACFESQIPDVRAIELPERTQNAVIVEARRR